MISLIANSVVCHLVPIFIRNDLTAYVKANQYRCDRTGIQAHRSTKRFGFQKQVRIAPITSKIKGDQQVVDS